MNDESLIQKVWGWLIVAVFALIVAVASVQINKMIAEDKKAAKELYPDSAHLEYRISEFYPRPERAKNLVSTSTDPAPPMFGHAVISIENVGKKATSGNFTKDSNIDFGDLCFADIQAGQGFRTEEKSQTKTSFRPIDVESGFLEEVGRNRNIFHLSKDEQFTFAPDGKKALLMVFEGSHLAYDRNEISATLTFDDSKEKLYVQEASSVVSEESPIKLPSKDLKNARLAVIVLSVCFFALIIFPIFLALPIVSKLKAMLDLVPTVLPEA